MTTLAKAQSLTHLSWSPKSDALLYLEDRETIVVHAISGERRSLCKGDDPAWLDNETIAFVRDHEIYSIRRDGSRETKIVDLNACWERTHKGSPLPTPDGKGLLFVVRDVPRTKSNWVPERAYPVRHFYGLLKADGTAAPINSWYYGGKSAWLGDGQRFAHHEFDATGGARIHVTDLDGKDAHVFRGYYPQIAPDGHRIASLDHDFKKVQIFDTRDGSSIERELPEDLAGGRFSNPALWLDDDHVLVEARSVILEIGLGKKDKAIKRLRIPIARRGRPTLAIAPDRKTIAYESLEDGQAEIRTAALEDWLGQTYKEPEPAKSDEEADGQTEDEEKATEE